MLTITTLGSWGLQHGDELDGAPAGAAKNLALLVYLACSPGASARRERLIDLLWADLDPTAGDHALRQIAWLLRKRLGDDCIRSAGGTVTLGCAFTCDRAAFLQAIESQDFETAVRLYGGDFLPGFAAPGGAEFEKWADLERRRLQSLFLLAAESLTRRWLAAGRFRDATLMAQRARDTNRDHEAGWRLLLEALTASGDTVSAAVEAEQLRRLLDEERRAPEPATVAAIRRVVDGPGIPSSAEPRPWVAELVGREQQFTAITAAWDAVRTGRGRHLHITAAAGLGKTRLLHDAVARLRAAGVAVAEARANPGERRLRFSLAADLAAALAALPGSGAVAPASAEALVALNPRLSNRYPGALRAHHPGDDASRLLALALADLIDVVTDESLVAVVIDDVHWADPDSHHLLESVLPRAAARRILFLTASRLDAEGRLERGDTQKLTLEPLTRPHVTQLLASAGSLPDAEWALELPAALHRATLGAPLLIVETLRLALSRQCLRLSDGLWTSPDPVALYQLLASGGALHQRIADLERDVAWLLTLLATAGVPLHQRVLSAAMPRPEAAILADLQELDRLGVAARLGEQWSPAHDEIAEHALGLATPEQIGAAHATLGRAMLAQADEPSILRAAAQHLSIASVNPELATAAERWVRAVRAAGDRRPARALVADLLSASGADARVQRLVRLLPWGVRFGRRALLAGAALGAAALMVTVLALLPRPAATLGVLVAVWRQEPSGRWRMYTHELTRRDLDNGRLAVASFAPTNLLNWDRASGNLRPGVSGTLATTRSFGTPGGEEVVLMRTGSAGPLRLTTSPGDDVDGAWSPDGRFLVIQTDRWSNASQSDLAIIDPGHPDSVVARLTDSPHARDVTPMWSPDGSRIAFLRTRHLDRQAPLLCLVSADGTGLRCLGVPGFEQGDLLGWEGPREIAAEFIGADGASYILVVNTESGAHREIAQGQGRGQSPVTGWIVCYCRRTAAEPSQTLLVAVGQPDRAIRIEPGDPPPRLAVFASARPVAFLDRLRITNADRLVPVDGPWRLGLQAWDAAANPVTPVAVRWWSSDSLVATVDSAGEVQPRREGRVTIHVTSGGWRRDSATIEIGPAQLRNVFRERWQDGIEPRWVPFGVPRPYLAESERGHTLAPNGDSTYFSGVFARQLLPTVEGLGVEFEASMPMTAAQWQNLTLDLVSADSLHPFAWDLAEGQLPVPVEEWRSCGVIYPHGRGNRNRSITLRAGTRLGLPVPPATARGRWVKLRLQLFPDGRCGLAINDTARAIIDRAVPMGDSALLILWAVSHRTRILVGPLDVWTGVRRDVDWGAVAGDPR